MDQVATRTARPPAPAPSTTAAEPDPVQPRAAGRRRPRAVGGHGAAGAVVLGVTAAAGVLAVAGLLGGAAEPQTLSDPGPGTRWGVLVARTVHDVAGIGTLGLLLVAVALLPRGTDGFGPDAARLVRAVTGWSALWAASAAGTALLTLSSVAGMPVPQVLAPDVLPLMMDLEVTRSLLSTAWLALLLAVGARVTRSPATGVLLLLTAVGAVVLPLLTGHAGHGELPVLTATALALHVVAAAAWVGGLGALVLHLRRSDVALAVALPRFSRLALLCFVAVGASGALTGWASFAAVDQVWTTAYGQLLLGKVAALVALGLIGHRHRARTVAAAAQRVPGGFVRLAACELVLMACVAALAVALSHTPPPPEGDHGAAGVSSSATASSAR